MHEASRADVKYGKRDFVFSVRVNATASKNHAFYLFTRKLNVSLKWRFKGKRHHLGGVLNVGSEFDTTSQINTETKCQRKHLEPDVFYLPPQNLSAYLQ